MRTSRMSRRRCRPASCPPYRSGKGQTAGNPPASVPECLARCCPELTWAQDVRCRPWPGVVAVGMDSRPDETPSRKERPSSCALRSASRHRRCHRPCLVHCSGRHLSVGGVGVPIHRRPPQSGSIDHPKSDAQARTGWASKASETSATMAGCMTTFSYHGAEGRCMSSTDVRNFPVLPFCRSRP